MKIAKIALTTVIFLAVIGGTLAFKATRNFDVRVYTATITNGRTFCTVPTIVENATITGPGIAFTTVATLFPATIAAPCPTITLRNNL
ncbi:hypothetical protein QFZ51_005444 [Chitinophaga sp. W3I9]|uniref:hypothetical protein n=1 Tax=Chitinophaga sp. W3I9 TaxID=3373924 RepID=UPI003D1D1865